MTPLDHKVETIDGYRILWANSAKLPSVLDELERGAVDGVFLSRMMGFAIRDFNRICESRKLKALIVHLVDDMDISSVGKLTGLEMLKIATHAQKLDLSGMSSLRVLALEWTSKTTLPAEAKLLWRLALNGYKPKIPNLDALYRFNGLKQLVLNKSTHRSLDGIAELSALEVAEFNYCRNLESVAGVNGTEIKELLMNNCPNIVDLERLEGCQRLARLHYNSCHAINSLSFLKRLPSLLEFTFVGTNVLDGDLSPLLSLTYSGFDDRKHFSHRYDELSQLRSNVTK